MHGILIVADVRLDKFIDLLYVVVQYKVVPAVEWLMTLDEMFLA